MMVFGKNKEKNWKISDGLFIGNSNDMRGSVWNEFSHIWDVYKEKQMYTYECHAREWTHVFIMSFSI